MPLPASFGSMPECRCWLRPLGQDEPRAFLEFVGNVEGPVFLGSNTSKITEAIIEGVVIGMVDIATLGYLPMLGLIKRTVQRSHARDALARNFVVRPVILAEMPSG